MKKIMTALAVMALTLGLNVATSTPASASVCGYQNPGPTIDGTTVSAGGHNYHPTHSISSGHTCPGGLIYVSNVQAVCMTPPGVFAVYLRIKYSNGVVGNEVGTDNYSTIRTQVGVYNGSGLTFVILYRDWCNFGHAYGMTVWS